MQYSIAVIGAAFGDEGKGHITDFLAHDVGENGIVIRFSGGAQAGHTVVTPDGRRHVFSHFGAGTLAGLPTYLSEFFLVNPALWAMELVKLQLNVKQMPTLYVDYDAPLSTVYDMLKNQARESLTKHGSCGMGIGETMRRRVNPRLRTKAGHLINDWKGFLKTLDRIEQDTRDFLISTETSFPNMTKFSTFLTPEFKNLFIEQCMRFREAVKFVTKETLDSYAIGIFEGSQGLLLDMDHQFFPHVTYAHTGLDNVCAILGKGPTEVIYVTRSYMTRHGAGPFPTENPDMKFRDDTNVTGPWQGKLRFGHFDKALIGEAIQDDLDRKEVGRDNVKVSMAITHLDQHPIPEMCLIPDFLKSRLHRVLLVSGPTREHVRLSEFFPFSQPTEVK